ncbi:hypothetical protein [Phytoactinopolyspora halotolerans]|uniref:Uncharacterized protein n=1 Tax=Phytoactinopolyspora halotolerans TaxID=1981512 RepID=A0A6L9SC51_9ACTN|nr:hypothetical protein [Phytoactinopolyspora halotolerans]NEE02254.1 hypothetical protein [Phytoactinopolyspora halotolerans]
MPDQPVRTPDRLLARRTFLARIGVLGATSAVATAIPATTLARTSQAAPAAPAHPDTASVTDAALDRLLDLLRPVLSELSRDTLSGLVVMTSPGPDRFSAAQGTPRPEPGAIEAGGTDFIIEALDGFVPFPDQLSTPLLAALTTALDDTGIALPTSLNTLLLGQVATLDQALLVILRNDQTLPLSLVVALLLNLLATQVNPLSVTGVLSSPFARLSLDEKCRAFELLEGPDADLIGLLDANLPEPLRDSLSGLLRFLAGALLEFSAFGSYNEWAVFDRQTRELTARPVGWELSGYQPDGVVHGWDDFIGYYQDRSEVGA